jgi:hypothetical protein
MELNILSNYQTLKRIMKKQHIIFFAALLALCAVSCQKDQDAVTLNAVIQKVSNDSKVYINDHTPYWHNGDRIRINDVDYTLQTAMENSAQIPNVANSTSGYRAIFPAGILTNSDANINSSSSVAVTLPATQVFEMVGTHQRVDVPMGAFIDRGSTLQFHNLCSVVRVYVSNAINAQLPVTDITITAESATLSGTGTATITGEKRKRKSYDEEVLKQGVTLCDDGKYRWIYAMNMWKNPTILFVVVKIFFWVLVGILAFILLLNICENGWKLDDVWDITWPFLILMGVFAVLILIAYAIIAAMYGGKYIVLFTMDEEGVLHEQIASQAKKAQKIGAITAVAGALTGKPAMVGLGATSAARTSMSSDFSKVRSINPIRGCNVIKIREFLSTNHVYARDEDFDFVYNFIKDRCPRVK